MSRSIKALIGITCLSTYMLFTQGFKIDTDHGTEFIPDKMICNGRHWTEVEGKANIQKFSQLWNDNESWSKRAKTIKENILNGIQWDKISFYSSELNVIKHSKKIMNGYSVENIAIESFPGFYITGNLYRPLAAQKKICCYFKPSWTFKG